MAIPAWDASSRKGMPAPMTFPVVFRPGYLTTVLTKVASNSGNVPCECLVMVADVSASVADNVVVGTFSIAVVTTGETPAQDDRIANNVPILGQESLCFPGRTFILPANGELWMLASLNSALIAYVTIWQYV